MELLTRQPTMRRAYTSITKAPYCQPCQVETYVKSDTHSWLGRSALNCRLTLSSGHGNALSGTVVRTTLPRRSPCNPKRFHQPLNGATGHLDALAAHLMPDLVGAVDLHAGLPDLLDLRHQEVIRPGAGTAQLGLALARGMAPIP